MPAPFFDNDWSHAARMRQDAEALTVDNARIAANVNSPGRVIWELGLVLAVPLAGAGLVEIVLRALQIY